MARLVAQASLIVVFGSAALGIAVVFGAILASILG